MAGSAGLAALEEWARNATQGYPGVSIKNMTTSFKNGLAFCAIIHRYHPELIDFASLSGSDIEGNCSLAFDVAESKLGIPALLDPEDMARIEVPDRLSIATYIAMMHKSLVGDKKRSAAVPPIHSNGVAKKPRHLNEIDGAEADKIIETARMSSRSPRLAARNVCTVCKHQVFILERVMFGKKLYHKSCLRCSNCNAVLNQNTADTSTEGKLFCLDRMCQRKLHSRASPARQATASDLKLWEKPSQAESPAEPVIDRVSPPSESSEAELAKLTMTAGHLTESEPAKQEDKNNEPPKVNNLRALWEDKITQDPGKDWKTSSFRHRTNVKNFLENAYAKDDSAIPPPLPKSPVPRRVSKVAAVFEKPSTPTVVPPDEVDAVSKVETPKNDPVPVISITPVDVETLMKDSSSPTEEREVLSEATTPVTPVVVPALVVSSETKTEMAREEEQEQPVNPDAVGKYSTVEPQETFVNTNVVYDPANAVIEHEDVKDDEKQVDHFIEEALENIPEVETKLAAAAGGIEMDDSMQVSEEKVVTEKMLKSDPTTAIPPASEAVERMEDSAEIVQPEATEVSPKHETNVTVEDLPTDVVTAAKDVIPDAKEVAGVSEDSQEAKLSEVERSATSSKEETEPLEESVPIEQDESSSFSKEEMVIEPINTRKPSDDLKLSNNEEPDVSLGNAKLESDASAAGAIATEESGSPEQEEASKESENAVEADSVPSLIAEQNTEEPKREIHEDELNPFLMDDDEAEETDKSVTREIELKSDTSKVTSAKEALEEKPVPVPRVHPRTKSPSKPQPVPRPRSSISEASKEDYPVELNPFESDDLEPVPEPSPSKPQVKERSVPPNPFEDDEDEDMSFSSSPLKSMLNKSDLINGSTRSRYGKTRHAPLPPAFRTPPASPSKPKPREKGHAPPPPRPPPPSLPNSPLKVTPERKDSPQSITSKPKNSPTSLSSGEKKVIPASPDLLKGLKSKKVTAGRKKRRAPPPKRYVPALPEDAIKTELEDLHVQEKELERQGVTLEGNIRRLMDEDDPKHEGQIDEMMIQLWNIVNEKNDILRRQTELDYLRRGHRLEEVQADIEFELRVLMDTPIDQRPQDHEAREKELLEDLLRIVDERNEVVDWLDYHRLNQQEEDIYISSSFSSFSSLPRPHTPGVIDDGAEVSDYKSDASGSSKGKKSGDDKEHKKNRYKLTFFKKKKNKAKKTDEDKEDNKTVVNA